MKDQCATNRTSSVRGGKGHALVVELLGVLAQQSAVPDDRIAVHVDVSRGGPHAVAVGQISDQVEGHVSGQATAEQVRRDTTDLFICHS
jgi:hypothetical protein